MDYKQRLLAISGPDSPVKWDEITDVYGESPRKHIESLMNASTDEQDGILQEFFAGMFHQEIPEPALPQMMEPLLVLCTLDNLTDEAKSNTCATLSYIAEQGRTLNGEIGHMPLRVGFYESKKPSVEMQCVFELRKHKDILWADEQRKHEELEAAGVSEWPTYHIIAEYLVMNAFRDNLGTGIKLERFTAEQQALIAFLHDNGIETWMERFAGVTTDNDA